MVREQAGPIDFKCVPPGAHCGNHGVGDRRHIPILIDSHSVRPKNTTAPLCPYGLPQHFKPIAACTRCHAMSELGHIAVIYAEAAVPALNTHPLDNRVRCIPKLNPNIQAPGRLRQYFQVPQFDAARIGRTNAKSLKNGPACGFIRAPSNNKTFNAVPGIELTDHRLNRTAV